MRLATGPARDDSQEVAGMNREEKLKMLAVELDGLPEEIYDDLLVKLTATARKHHEEIVAAVGSGDLATAARLAHAIKGGAANLRAHELRAAAEELEAGIADPADRDGCRRAVDCLEQALIHLEQDLEAQ
jgi:HPt (histidine-containing phosphotransfer) domain-containing protein